MSGNTLVEHGCEGLTSAVIVTFNPDMTRLGENLEAVSRQVSSLIIVDNASQNIDEIEAALRAYRDTYLVKRATNNGIASALNAGIETAQSLESEFALLLDQDSVCSPGMVAQLKSGFNEGVAMCAPTIADRNIGMTRGVSPHQEVDYCITSGSLCRVDEWSKIGKYDERMFIDFVDFDFCLRLRMAGFDIVRVSEATLVHEIGAGRKRGPIITYNYSPFRSRHMAADMLYYARKHASSPKELKVSGRGRVGTYLVLVRKMVIVSIFERQRFSKVTALMRGTLSGTIQSVTKVRTTALAE